MGIAMHVTTIQDEREAREAVAAIKEIDAAKAAVLQATLHMKAANVMEPMLQLDTRGLQDDLANLDANLNGLHAALDAWESRDDETDAELRARHYGRLGVDMGR
jgi:hypothetical protein